METMEAAQLLLMPHEVWAGVAWCLDVADVGHIGPCCRLLSQEATDQELWFHLFMRTSWPPCSALLAFVEGGGTCPSLVDWRGRARARTDAIPTIVVDIGRGYTKFAIAHGSEKGREGESLHPHLVQLCSSPTHPPDCDRGSQLRFILTKLQAMFCAAALDADHPLHHIALVPDAEPVQGGIVMVKNSEVHPELNGQLVRLRVNEPGTELWTANSITPPGTKHTGLLRKSCVPLRQPQDMPMLIGEPFWATANRHRDSINASDWARKLQSDLLWHSGPVRIVPQAQMALWGHAIDHGIVVNIGQAQTLALPVIHGEVVPDAVTFMEIGSGSLTMRMVNLLAQRFDWMDSAHMTWCRDLKEQHCYVAPPAPKLSSGRSLGERLAAGDDSGVARISVSSPAPGHENIVLGEERILVPEMLFDPPHRDGGLPQLVIDCAERCLSQALCSAEDVRALLRQVVLVGGTADFPGLRPRMEYEMRELVREHASCQLRNALESADDVFVLNPPLGDHGPLTTPRFVPLFGGCVRAAGSFKFDEWKNGETLAGIADAPTFNPRLLRVPGIAAWAERRLPAMYGPAIFRTGGGGGEDDNIWRIIGLEGMDEDDDDSDVMGMPMPSDSMDSDEEEETCDEESLDLPDRSSNGDAAQQPSRQQSRNLRRRKRGRCAGSEEPVEETLPTTDLGGADSSRASRATPARNSRWRGKGKSKGKAKGRGKGNGKAGGKGNGTRPRERLVWRPVAQQS